MTANPVKTIPRTIKIAIIFTTQLRNVFLLSLMFPSFQVLYKTHEMIESCCLFSLSPQSYVLP
jgi:hypothetical protein